ncbi:MAG: DUF6364 family protein [Gammaproteobacteria bacterium]
MKTKLTITVDNELLPVAKRYARSKGISLSQLIETTLKSMSSHQQPSFSDRWKGKFEPANREDARYRQLARKYL